MDPTSERNLTANTHGPLMIEVMIVPVSAKSQIIYCCFLAFLTRTRSSGLLTNPFLPFGQISLHGQISPADMEMNKTAIK